MSNLLTAWAIANQDKWLDGSVPFFVFSFEEAYDPAWVSYAGMAAALGHSPVLLADPAPVEGRTDNGGDISDADDPSTPLGGEPGDATITNLYIFAALDEEDPSQYFVHSYMDTFDNGDPINVDLPDDYNITVVWSNTTDKMFNISTHHVPGPESITAAAGGGGGGGGGSTPVANFTATPNSNAPVPAEIVFDSSGSSTDESATITGYLWDFGDGGSSTDANPTHTYTVASPNPYSTGSGYAVTLTITDSEGHTASFTDSVFNVGSEAFISLSFTPPATAGDDATLIWDVSFGEDASTYPGNAQLLVGPDSDYSHASPMGSPSGPLSGGPITDHVTFPTAGTFHWFIEYSGDDIHYDTVFNGFDFTIAEPSFAAELTVLPTSGSTGTIFSFDASGSIDTMDGSTITDYSFDYDDGNTDSGASPTADHTYAAIGIYHVVVTVTESGATTSTDSVDVVVTVPAAIKLTPPMSSPEDLALFVPSASHDLPDGIIAVRITGTMSDTAAPGDPYLLIIEYDAPGFSPGEWELEGTLPTPPDTTCCDASGMSLSINGIPLNAPSWNIDDLWALTGDPAYRDGSVHIPGVPGREWYGTRPDLTTYSLRLFITGEVDQDGIGVADDELGMFTNLLTLRKYVTGSVTTDDGTLSATFVTADGVSHTFPVRVWPLRLNKKIGFDRLGDGVNRRGAYATLKLDIPAGTYP